MVDVGVDLFNTVRCTNCYGSCEERNSLFIIKGWPFCTKKCIVSFKDKEIRIGGYQREV